MSWYYNKTRVSCYSLSSSRTAYGLTGDDDPRTEAGEWTEALYYILHMTVCFAYFP